MTMPGGLLGQGFEDGPQNGGLLGKMLPAGASPYGQMLGPEQLSALRHQALLNMGATLLQASGPHPQGTGPNLSQALGAAVQNANWPGMLNDAGQAAMGLDQYMMRARQMQAIQAVGQKYPVTPDMTPDQRVETLEKQMGELASMGPAGQAAAKELAPVIRSIKDGMGKQGGIHVVTPGAGGAVVLDDKGNVVRQIPGAEPTPQAGQLMEGISGSALGLDPRKTYRFYQDRNGQMIGQPMEEGINAAQQARLSLREEMTPVQQMRGIQQTVSSYRQWMKNEIPVQQSWASMKLIADRAATGTGAPDDLIGLVDVMSKMYNPGSIVRVGTVKVTMDKLGSWKQKLQNWKSQGLTGAPDPDLVKQIAGAAQALASEHQKYSQDILQKHLNIGKKYRVPTEEMRGYLSDPWSVGPSAMGDEAPAAAPAPSGRPPLDSFMRKP